MQTILVTGGAGYIGSHTVIELLAQDYRVIIVDNFCNSSPKVLERIEKISGKSVVFYEADISNQDALENIFINNNIDAVIHFAALKAVGESVQKPALYYENNVSGSMVLFRVMNKYGVKRIVFSSSATVYGDPTVTPITEDFSLSATNPYAWTKLMMEQILRDIYRADNDWSIGILRYFNPIGAHESGLIGENPNGIPNNLMPYITQVAVGKLAELNVFGDDYPTHDGTGIRDYIHVVDLAQGHLKALEYLFTHNELLTVNLGTGVGYSVLDVVKAFSDASGCKIPYVIRPRRSGDVTIYLADPTRAKELIGWSAQFDLNKMCQDSWRWQQMNPNGYE
ncbi:MAG: UDP-glucose 4-epimerase GalE [Proteobacteria bacterium]|nr:MAG: UDP-glucose 4-epimerase GalE [Pseudomonadota bacterium]